MQNQTFKLSLKPNDYPPNLPFVYADQYDVGRVFVATVYDTDGSLYNFNGETVTVVGTKPSGTGFSYPATASGNTVTFETTGQMTVVAGNVTCGIIIEKDGDRIGTLHFVLHVQPAALSADTIIDSDDFGSIISDAVAEYMEEHGIVIDPTLSVAGAAADAKATGDAIDELKSALENSGLSDDAKEALLACFQNVAWINEDGQTYYDILEAALYNDYPKIIATFSPGVNVIYTGDELDTLKQYLTVKYYTSKADTGTTIPAENYILSGMLRDGENTILVVYNTDYKTTFIVNVIDYHTVKSWTSSDRLVTITSRPPGVYSYNGTRTAGVGDGTYNTRRNCALTRGEVPFYIAEGSDAGTFADYYPIPVPPDTSTVTVSAGSTSYYVGLLLFRLDKTTGIYSRLQDSGWSQTSQTITYSDADAGDLYITINTKNGSAGTATFSSDPAYSITFS